MKKIVIQGFYGANNLGDDFILYSLLNSINNIGKCEVIVMSYGDTYEYLFQKYPKLQIKAFIAEKHTIADKLKVICKADAWIIGGGGLFPNESIKESGLLLVKVVLAILSRTKLAIYGVEFNSFDKIVNRNIWKLIFLLCDMIVVRNKDSVLKINGLGIKKVKYGTDITFSLQTNVELNDNGSILKKLSLEKNKYIIWALAMPWTDEEMQEKHFQLRYKSMTEILLDTINRYSEYVHVLLPFFYPSDIKLINDLKRKLTVKYIICDKKTGVDLDEKRYIFKYARMAVCMRFHSVVFSLYHDTPFCAISYSPKTSNILMEQDMTENMVEFGIRNSQFFYREFDLDGDKFRRIVAKHLYSSKSDGKIKHSELIKYAKINENRLIEWLKGAF